MAARVSVVVVSRDRPMALARCLAGLTQLDYDPFEVIVVACPKGHAIASADAQAGHIKLIPFDEPNISVARNLGIAEAAGDIVAFIDDDSVPEPLWLHHLSKAFDNPQVSAAGGYVIGRNGISFQWRARTVDAQGRCHDLPLDTDRPTIPDRPNGTAIKTEGTNMAVRRSVFGRIGGFDTGFHFYLDETDLNLRLAKAGLDTAIVPLAQVHHGFEESAYRDSRRVPRDLTQIGASQRLFLRKHCASDQQEQAWHDFVQEQRLRLLRLAKNRKIGAAQMSELLRGLQDGGTEGSTRPIETPAPVSAPARPFQPFKGRFQAPRHVLAGRIWQRRKLRREAAKLVAEGNIVSLFVFSPSARFHKVGFSDNAVWEQFGGRFGRSVRTQPLWKYWRFKARLDAEVARTAAVRGTSNAAPDHHK